MKDIYDPAAFRKTGRELIDLIADHLESTQSGKFTKVLNYRDPEDGYNYWKNELISENEPIQDLKSVIHESINVYDPRYIGHQVSIPSPLSSLAGLLSDYLSNGTGVYEMGQASNAMEKVIASFMAKHIGYDVEKSGGFMTSGGTLANLTAILAARKNYKKTNIWKYGNQAKIAVMVSDQAHYCVDRAVRIMGLGDEGIIKTSTDKNFRMDTAALEKEYKNASSNGIHVFAIVASSCSTATGSYDNLLEIGSFCKKHDLWLHVDGAHGGPAIFSNRYRHLVEGILKADSVVIDFHKMMMVPSLSTFLGFRKFKNSFNIFSQDAHYLFDQPNALEWYHSAKRTFECTKNMMALKVYMLIKHYGAEGFKKNLETLYDNARSFAQMVQTRKSLELLTLPMSNIINFRYTSSVKNSNEVNNEISQRLLHSGEFYIVNSSINGKKYLRCTVMNPFTNEEIFNKLLNTIVKIGREVDY